MLKFLRTRFCVPHRRFPPPRGSLVSIVGQRPDLRRPVSGTLLNLLTYVHTRAYAHTYALLSAHSTSVNESSHLHSSVRAPSSPLARAPSSPNSPLPLVTLGSPVPVPRRTRAHLYTRVEKDTNSGTGTHVRGAFSREKRQRSARKRRGSRERERKRWREMPSSSSRLIPWTGRGQVSVRPCQPDRMLLLLLLLLPHRLRIPRFEAGPRYSRLYTGMHAVGWPGIPAALPRLLYTP